MKVLADKITESVEETVELGETLADVLKGKRGTFVAMYGDLGTGKTAFTRGFCSRLCPGDRVFSPTFAIINEYVSGDIPVYHFDVYRIEDDDDLYSTGFYEYIDREDGIILCEWSENIPYAIPQNRIEVRIEKCDPVNYPDRRRIQINEFN
ncbi:MAG: tRNA (adenosine(37)-N6)-threonylcarbamoyltransferase complex ATPase subunit type 1 TsaE [Ruminococcaceae bacterium]|nr:tRNA (adenosine(37)-N6)-threonylcarbamoyltransferase complex ATPase subunit type 1 TsaE [Oscillospiraceae bacterium]MBO4972173.1 tRNA (adenosine(37)-N6)-threonylcarbamoyltransferase complex ATPase subunit type 1 TsaE [Clostridia bacterium]MBQ1260133.1 tRNA (adenosine(37)-N6)-threonylcarbamoyltransferase complex ATPase subunit type 1 TsaE [Clostridia bacterium]